MMDEERVLFEWNERIREKALEYGLSFFNVVFELLDFDEMNEIAAYEGFPVRYPHWRFGMEYERLRKSYAYGLHRIYEMVINNDPCYAYLLRSNRLVDQKIVMAHVYAHCDFFKNNLWFAHTNRKMLNEMANHATRIRRYIDRYGAEEVEHFLDACLSLEDLIDCHTPPDLKEYERQEEDEPHIQIGRFKSKDYMDRYINPPEYLERERKKLEEEHKKVKVPPHPERDVLLFLIEHAPLKNWQADVLSIIREESYYFVPQKQTRVMNEGWASYWHAKMMTEGLLEPDEIIDYADHHSSIMGIRPGRINPYKLGLALFRDIEERWNKGRFGREYEECVDMEAKRNWDKQLGLGLQKIFEVRRIYNDIGFIDEFLTKEFCQEQKLFVFAERDMGSEVWYEITSKDFEEIKKTLLFSLTNFGKPIIYVTDGNYKNRGELYLTHQHEGVDMDLNYARATLVNLHTIWKRPVHVETVIRGQKMLLSYDGDVHRERRIKV